MGHFPDQGDERMKPLSQFDRIYLCSHPVDFRKSIDGLAYIVEQSLLLNPFESALFVFCNRAKDKIKALYWDRTGFALWYKRLDQNKFQWPQQIGARTLLLETHELEALLAGFSLSGHQAIPLWQDSCHC